MNDFNIDGSFSTLNENKFINLVLYDSYKFGDKKEPQYFNIHRKNHQRFPKIWQKLTMFI